MKFLVVKIIFLSMFFVFMGCAMNIPISTKDPEIFYYNRSTLDGDRQNAYDYILSELWDWSDAIVTETELVKTISFEGTGIAVTKDDIKKIVAYIKNDVHELYTLRAYTRDWVVDSNGYITSFKSRFFKQFSYEEYKASMVRINGAVEKILGKITPAMSEGQKVRLIYDELIKLVSYSLNSTNVDDIHGAFIGNKVLCDGYARGFAYLCQRAGLQTNYITGQSSVGLHAWNNVKVDGQWYHADPTWDDPLLGATDADGLPLLVKYDYFLLGDVDFLKEHTPFTEIDSVIYAPLPNTSRVNYPFDKTEY